MQNTSKILHVSAGVYDRLQICNFCNKLTPGLGTIRRLIKQRLFPFRGNSVIINNFYHLQTRKC